MIEVLLHFDFENPSVLTYVTYQNSFSKFMWVFHISLKSWKGWMTAKSKTNSSKGGEERHKCDVTVKYWLCWFPVYNDDDHCNYTSYSSSD